MKSLVMLLAALGLLVPQSPTCAASEVSASSAKQLGDSVDLLRGKRKSPRASNPGANLLKRILEDALGMSSGDIDKLFESFGLDADSGFAGGFVLILVLFILLVIIGAGFGGPR